MNQIPLISIIVPIYKSEKYLRKCIDSVLNQTYRNIELVLVDDGSPDNSGKICDEYKNNDNRVVVIHKKNGGVSDARNYGLICSKGSIISFVDPDDWYEVDTIECMYNRMCEDKSDIVTCGVKYVDENDRLLRVICVSDDECLVGEEAMREFLGYKKIKQQIWDKMYTREVIGNIIFEKGRSIEDVFWVHQIIGNAKKISVMRKPLYNYLQRSDSVMGSGYTSRWMDILDALQCRCEYIEKKYPNLYTQALRLYIGTCMYHLQLALQKKESKEICESIIRRINYYNNIVKQNKIQIKYESIQQKIWIKLFISNPKLTCILRNKLKVGL